MNSTSEHPQDGKAPGFLNWKRLVGQYFRESCLILVMLLGMFSLLAMILAQWSDLSQTTRILPASVLAVSAADYSGRHPTGQVQVQVIGLAILGDKLRDAGLQPGDLAQRLASVTAELILPVPTSTAMLVQTSLPNFTPTPTVGKSPKPPVPNTRTSIPTATQLPPATQTPLPSQTNPPPTATLPSPVPGPTRTMTPAPMPTNIPTSQPVPPTPQPPTQVPPTQVPPNPTNPPHPPHPTKEPKPTKQPKPTKKPHK